MIPDSHQVSAGAEGAVRIWWSREGSRHTPATPATPHTPHTPHTPVLVALVRAHSRYCTCVAADQRLRYIVTGIHHTLLSIICHLLLIIISAWGARLSHGH